MEKMKYMKKLGEKIHKRPRADAFKELNINNVRIETLILKDFTLFWMVTLRYRKNKLYSIWVRLGISGLPYV